MQIIVKLQCLSITVASVKLQPNQSITTKLKPSLLSNMLLHVCLLPFVIEVLSLVTDIQTLEHLFASF